MIFQMKKLSGLKKTGIRFPGTNRFMLEQATFSNYWPTRQALTHSMI